MWRIRDVATPIVPYQQNMGYFENGQSTTTKPDIMFQELLNVN
jgi:hypothetical protein